MLVRKYYRLTESYRDKTGKTRQHMILALGYMDELPEEEQRYQFLDCLNDLVLRGAQRLCPDKDVERYTYKVYQELRSRGLIDSVITNHREWRSLMPTLNNQVVITSAAKMQNGKYSGVRKCSEPEPELCHIYDVLKVGHIPIKPRKFLWTQKPDFEKSDP